MQESNLNWEIETKILDLYIFISVNNVDCHPVFNLIYTGLFCLGLKWFKIETLSIKKIKGILLIFFQMFFFTIPEEFF